MRWSYSSFMSTLMHFLSPRWTISLISIKRFSTPKTSRQIQSSINSTQLRLPCWFSESAGRLNKNKSIHWLPNVLYYKHCWLDHFLITLKSKTTSWFCPSSWVNQFSICLRKRIVLISCMKWTCKSFSNIQLLSRYLTWCMKESIQSPNQLWVWVRLSNVCLIWMPWTLRVSMKDSFKTFQTSVILEVPNRQVCNTTFGNKVSSKENLTRWFLPLWFVLL